MLSVPPQLVPYQDGSSFRQKEPFTSQQIFELVLNINCHQGRFIDHFIRHSAWPQDSRWEGELKNINPFKKKNSLCKFLSFLLYGIASNKAFRRIICSLFFSLAKTCYLSGDASWSLWRCHRKGETIYSTCADWERLGGWMQSSGEERERGRCYGPPPARGWGKQQSALIWWRKQWWFARWSSGRAALSSLAAMRRCSLKNSTRDEKYFDFDFSKVRDIIASWRQDRAIELVVSRDSALAARRNPPREGLGEADLARWHSDS